MADHESLLKYVLEEYRFHLLPLAREEVPVGLVYLFDGKRASDFAQLTQLFDPKFELPQPSKEDMSFFDGKVSQEVEVSFGLKLLGSFLAVFGAAGIVNKINASYQAKGTRSIVFSFSGVTRTYILPYIIKELLKGRSIRDEDLIRETQGEYYVVTGVVRSPSITIEAKDQNKKTAKVEVETAVAEVKGKVSTENIGEGSIKYSNTKDLAFGLQIHHLKYNRRENIFYLPEVTKAVQLRKAQDLRREVTYIEEPSLIGDQTVGDIYFPIS